MSVVGRCFACAESTPFGPVEPRHCYGKGDRPGTPGLIGSGFHCDCPCRSWPHQPHELYAVAAEEHPGDLPAIRERYLALMVEHGHVIERALRGTDKEERE